MAVTAQEAVRRLRIEATSTGVKEATADLNTLAKAQGGVAVSSDEASRATLSLEKRFDSIERRYNATIRAQQEYDKVQRQVNAAVQQNPALQDRANAVLAAARDRLNQVTGAANDNATATGLARHELINLGRQAQDVAVSLAGGQSPFTVLFQQGSQIGDVFTSSKGTISGFFGQVTGALGSFLTVGRLAFGGVTLLIGGAVSALFSYLDAQQKVNLALTGMGRGSGLTAANVNAAASAGSSLGFSVSDARELASALAATGKVANDNLLPIVKIGKDFATTFGVDAVEANKMLSQSFADPVRGAEQLNERLGFMDAAMQRQIASLVAQNRLYDAQKVLLAGVESSLAKTADVTSVWSQVWGGLKSTASNALDTVGEKLAHIFGLDLSLQQQKDRLEKELASYDSTLGKIFGTQADREIVIKQLDEINRRLEVQRQATQNVAAAQASLRTQQTVMAQLPEVAQRQTLADQASVAGAVSEDPSLQKSLGISQQQADRVRAILDQVKRDYKTTFEEIQANSKIAVDAVTAFSPAAKAMIAARQATEQYRAAGGIDPAEKARIAQDAYNLSLRQSGTALSEAARARELSATQSVASAQLEIYMIGKSIGQQVEMRANLQARQALEQQASQNRTAFDTAEYERLKLINAEYAKKVQVAAEKSLKVDIEFTANTTFLSDADKQIASILRQTYGNDKWQSMMDGPIAGAMRFNTMLAEVNSTIRSSAASFANDFVSGIMSGKSAMESLQGAATSLGKSLTTAGINNIIKDPTSITGYVEAGIGILAQMFGGADASKKKLEAAQKVWKEAGPAFQQFLTEMSGGVQGDLMNKIASARASAETLGQKAWDAGDYSAVNRIVTAYQQMYHKAAQNFVATMGATLQGLSDGLGADSPFLKAVQTVKDQLTSVQSFVDDVRTSSGLLSGALSEDTLMLTNNAAAIAYMNGEIAKAQDAAKTYLLSLLEPAPQLSEVATKMLDIQGRAAALQGALEQLGMSSADAAKSISEGVQKAIDDLRKSFDEGLTSRLNTAQGKGYLNDTATLIAQHQQDIADAARLGLDMTLVNTVFAAEAQKIVEDAGLVGDSFNEFTTIFPDLAGVVTQSTTEIQKAAEELQTFVTSVAKTIKAYLEGLKTGASSTLSPQQQLAAAQSNFSAQLALAQGGNRDALSGITAVAQTLLDQAKSFYASSGGYASIYDQVTSALQGLGSGITAGTVASADAQAIVAAVNTASASNDNLTAQQLNILQAQTALQQSQTALLGAINSLTASGNGTADRIINAINGLGDITAQIGSQECTYLFQIMRNGSGGSGGGTLWDWLGFAQGGRIPAYADGGVIANGIYGVDSVMARLPNGRPIGLAGGEFMTQAPSVNAMTLPVLDYINRTGRAPANGNGDGSTREAIRALAGWNRADADRVIAKLDQVLGALETAPAKTADATRRLVASAKPRAA
jgi:phage-related minor tail protein